MRSSARCREARRRWSSRARPERARPRSGSTPSAATSEVASVVSCRPVQSEMALSYAALGDLVGGALESVLVDLPVPQRRALEVALRLEEGSTRSTDHRAVTAGVRSLLVAMARRAAAGHRDRRPAMDRSPVGPLDRVRVPTADHRAHRAPVDVAEVAGGNVGAGGRRRRPRSPGAAGDGRPLEHRRDRAPARRTARPHLAQDGAGAPP